MSTPGDQQQQAHTVFSISSFFFLFIHFACALQVEVVQRQKFRHTITTEDVKQ